MKTSRFGLIAAVVSVLASMCAPFVVFAQQMLPVPGATGSTVGYKQQLQPVCTHATYPSDSGLTSGTAYQQQTRSVYYCPRGASALAIMYSGTWDNAGVETDLVSPIPINAGVEVPAASPQTVPSLIVPVTCNGQRPCYLPTVTNAATNSVTQGNLITDTVTVNVPAGTYIAVRTYVFQSSGQKTSLARYSNYPQGESCSQSASLTDNSITGAAPFAYSNSCYTPSVIMGVPATSGPSVCILGTSREIGFTGSAGVYIGASPVSGGSGYVVGDIGTIFTVPGGAGGVAAQGVITGVSGGAVAQVLVYQPGSYATLPSSPQAITGGHGTGLSVSISQTGSYDVPDSFGEQGYVEKGLSGTVPYMTMARGSSTALGWAARNYTRIDMILKSGCSSVVDGYGTVDLSSGLATMQAEAIVRWRQMKSAGKSVYPVTLMPITTSTDGWATTANQSIEAYESIRTGYNDWLRANLATLPIDGYFETANAVETAQDSGLWKVNGTAYAYTIDGVHPVSTGISAAAAVIAANKNIIK